MVALRTDKFIPSHDGLALFYQTWAPPSTLKPKAQLFIVHGYGEHGARYRELAHTLAQHAIVTNTLDLRGHGHSAGLRGHVEHFAHYLNDVDTGLAQTNESLPTFVLGHSLGGLISIDFVCSRRPNIRGLILSNPFLDLAMKVPALKITLAELAGQMAPRLALPSGLQASDITRVEEISARYQRDPLVFGTATAGWLRETKMAQARVRSYDQVNTALYYLYSDSDPIANPAANRALANQLKSDDKTIQERENELHEILNEIDRHQLHQDIADWIKARI